MKRISIVGLSLFALIAFSAMATSSAYAGEIGICKKLKGGKYADKNCQTLAGEPVAKHGKYEWETYAEAVAKGEGGEFVFTSKGKTAELKTELGTIVCKKNTDKGEWTSGTTNVDEITFVDCINTATKLPCFNEGEPTKKGGTITVVDDTKIVEFPETGGGYLKAAPKEGEAWIQYEQDETGPTPGYDAVFACETGLPEPDNLDPIYVSGDVSGVTAANVSNKKTVTTFSETGGAQELLTTTYNFSLELVTIPSIQIAVGDATYASAVEIKVP